eukprot:CAMPEP_0195285398 /NCGR_PEP_ID=MMETSP0707-20130614/3242_1 /TAXON_ID=33640 /ORGANISM="Asterionellopsis glacialis, Strain CCMP134" /LENGTH=1388 /DNA_ID=CAMNT_0040344885 /DNA_START=294 /DNA_END=4460 /DNA_ORIENTATION=+
MKRQRQRQPSQTTMRRSSPLLVILLVCSLTILVTPIRAAAPNPPPPTNDNFSTTTTAVSPPSSNKDGGKQQQQHLLLPNGPIQDATCDVEQLEDANDSQLHIILQELVQTTFFRTFAVDLDHRCPLASWNKNTHHSPSNQEKDTLPPSSDATTTATTTTTSQQSQTTLNDNSHNMFAPTTNDESDPEFCAGELPDLDEDAEPACHVQQEDDDPFSMGGGSSFSTSSPLSSSSSSSAPTPMDNTNMATTTTTTEPVVHSSTNNNNNNNNNDEEEEPFECDGGDMADEMDEDDDPLCELTEEYFEVKSPLYDLISSTLRSIGALCGWESESQKQTFDWANPSDPVVVSSTEELEPECTELLDDSGLPHNFWMDMCSEIKVGEGVKLVNLALNPERNTGYNGTHIWKAIYDENCVAVDGLATAPMCYEERVLYRLLSALHSSTTLSIAKNYYPPSKRKNRKEWEPNPQFFMDKFGDNPDHIRNLHFSYVVLLRALQKSSPFLYNYDIRTGNIVEDETASILLKRLLDSTILRSCQNVFTAFDESVMFKEALSSSSSSSGGIGGDDVAVSLQQNFKGVFHNISSVLDCVQCQQCKLHGKMAMLGYGTALKILFTKDSALQASNFERNEIVAFINTIAKFSESLHEVRELTQLYWDKHPPNNNKEIDSGPDTLDGAIGFVSSLANQGLISVEREAELVQFALERHTDLLVLIKHYKQDVSKFLRLSSTIGSLGTYEEEPDAIIIGSGLAGLSAALHILDRGGTVVVVEKEHLLGGNSNKASSGINAAINGTAHDDDDDLETFKNDTIRSAGNGAQAALIETLVENSREAITFLTDRVGVDLSLLAQLGGHSSKRTHRPSNGMAGAEIIYGIQKAVKEYKKSGKVKIMTDTKVTSLLTDEKSGAVLGVEYETLSKGSSEKGQIKSPNTVLATGGFAADRSEGSYLSRYRPELMKMPATAGAFSTGDGVALATTLGADVVNMDKIQIHPTGWVDPSNPSNPSKILAAELMRGVGGILINDQGKRFCNELGTRAYVTDKMLAHDPYYAEHGEWNKDSKIPTFSLVLSSAAAQDGKKHVDLYTHKGLLQKFEGIAALAEWMGQDVDTLRSTFIQYQLDAKQGTDEWGKSVFRGVAAEDLDNEVFYGGTIVPVLHYCMGGVTIDTEGNVLKADGQVIPGLHAAGEVAGGVHGNNRLAGNSLLECTVYGTIVGKKIPVKERVQFKEREDKPELSEKKLRDVPLEELMQHNTEEDCWVAIHGKVYDLTEFAEEHPAGAKSIHDLAGMDGTAAFSAVHNENMMDDFDEEIIGYLVVAEEKDTEDSNRQVAIEELEQHNTSGDCWVAIHGNVYDMTEFAKEHPGGPEHIIKVAGTDGTEAFDRVHKKKKLLRLTEVEIGSLI